MRYILLTIFSILLVLNVNAQDTVSYSLKTLTVREFLENLPDFSSINNGYDYVPTEQESLAQIIRAAEAEFLWRYPSADTNTLILAFEKFKLPLSCYPLPRCTFLLPAIDYGLWFKRILETWLEENLIDFDSIHAFEFADFTVYIEQRDFSGDGQHEWLLEMVKQAEGQEIEYARYFVVSQSSEGYRLSSVPLDGTLNWWQHNIDERPLTEIGFEDINADGKPEWIFDWTWSYVSTAGMGGGRNAIVLGWQNYEIVILAELKDFQILVNTDDDPALEALANSNVSRDYWGCGTRVQNIYDWDGEYYRISEPETTEFDCIARFAEDAMWGWDFETAIEYYDEFLQENFARYESYLECRAEGDFICDDRTILLYQYFLVRRIVAHALLGNHENVRTLLSELDPDVSRTGFAQSIINANSAAGETLCYAAYNYFVDEHPFVTDWEYDYRVQFGDSRMDDGSRYINLPYLPIDPFRAGCDIRLFTAEATPTPTATFVPYPTSMPATPDSRSQEEIWLDEQNFYDAFLNHDYETALRISQTAIVIDEFDRGRLLYYQALAHEALSQFDEALLAFRAIYEEMPNSAWGILAILHLEQSNP